jgi:hypothetical protein
MWQKYTKREFLQTNFSRWRWCGVIAFKNIGCLVSQAVRKPVSLIEDVFPDAISRSDQG